MKCKGKYYYEYSLNDFESLNSRTLTPNFYEITHNICIYFGYWLPRKCESGSWGWEYGLEFWEIKMSEQIWKWQIGDHDAWLNMDLWLNKAKNLQVMSFTILTAKILDVPPKLFSFFFFKYRFKKLVCLWFYHIFFGGVCLWFLTLLIL